MESINDVREAKDVEETGLDTENSESVDELLEDLNETDDSEGINDSGSEDNDDYEVDEYDEEYDDDEYDDDELEGVNDSESNDEDNDTTEYANLIQFKINILVEKLSPPYEDLVIEGGSATDEERESKLTEIATTLVGERTDDLDRVKEQLSRRLEDADISVEALQEGAKLAEKLSTCQQKDRALCAIGLSDVYGIVASVRSPTPAEFEVGIPAQYYVHGFTASKEGKVVHLPDDAFYTDLTFGFFESFSRNAIESDEKLADPLKVSVDVGELMDSPYAFNDCFGVDTFASLCRKVGEIKSGDATVRTDTFFAEYEKGLDESGNYSNFGRHVSINKKGHAHIVKGDLFFADDKLANDKPKMRESFVRIIHEIIDTFRAKSAVRKAMSGKEASEMQDNGLLNAKIEVLASTVLNRCPKVVTRIGSALQVGEDFENAKDAVAEGLKNTATLALSLALRPGEECSNKLLDEIVKETAKNLKKFPCADLVLEQLDKKSTMRWAEDTVKMLSACSSIEEVEALMPKAEEHEAIHYSANNGLQYRVQDGKAAVIYNWGGRVNIEVPSEIRYNGQSVPVVEIAPWAFQDSCIKSINAPSVQTIGERAFERCKNIAYAEFPNAECVGDLAFYNCRSLGEVILSDKCVVNDSAFYKCDGTEIITEAEKASKKKSALMSAGCLPQESSQQENTKAKNASKAPKAGKGR